MYNELNKVVEDKIVVFRNQKVIIDADLAFLYEVKTRDINKAVKNNPEKFPVGYYFELNSNEKKELVENFHHLEKLKFSTANPKVFTEKGLYMLATILKSRRATETTISIIETFSKIKDLARNIRESNKINNINIKKNLLQRSNELFKEIIDDNLQIKESESSIEINLALIKLKHTIKRK